MLNKKVHALLGAMLICLHERLILDDVAFDDICPLFGVREAWVFAGWPTGQPGKPKFLRIAVVDLPPVCTPESGRGDTQVGPG
jgi:hypothetical protein